MLYHSSAGRPLAGRGPPTSPLPVMSSLQVSIPATSFPVPCAVLVPPPFFPSSRESRPTRAYFTGSEAVPCAYVSLQQVSAIRQTVGTLHTGKPAFLYACMLDSVHTCSFLSFCEVYSSVMSAVDEAVRAVTFCQRLNTVRVRGVVCTQARKE